MPTFKVKMWSTDPRGGGTSYYDGVEAKSAKAACAAARKLADSEGVLAMFKRGTVHFEAMQCK